MSTLLAGLATDDSLQNDTDTLGGGGPLDSGAYTSTVTLAYLQKSQGGALGLHLHFKTDQGQEFRNTLYVTSGDTKGNKNFYERNGEKFGLPGFVQANSLCLLTVAKELAAMDTEEKVVKLYSFDAGAEVPTKVDCLTELHGQEVIVGLQKQIVDKRAKQNDGSYGPTGETREENEIDKFFRARDGMTTGEIKAQASEASFIETWKEKWTGKTRNRATGQAAGGGQAGAPAANGQQGAPAAAAGTTKPKASLFA